MVVELLGMELELGGGKMELLLGAMEELLGFAEDEETSIFELLYLWRTCSSLGKSSAWLSVQDRRRVKPKIANLR